jgi:valyl-tRNA synthetase
LPEGDPATLTVGIEDRWIFSRLNSCAEQVNRAIEQYRFHEAAQLLWHFFWHEFCDWYLELKKLDFRRNSGLTPGWRNTLAAFETALRLLHPAMPFLTEELWQRLATDRNARPISIALARYPQYRKGLADLTAEREIEILQEVVTMARTLRTEAKLDPKQPLEGALYSRGPGLEVARRHAEAIRKLANVNLEFQADAAPKAAAIKSTAEFDLVLHLPKGQEDAQRKRVEKEIEQLAKNIANQERQLGDDKFLSKAPAHVVDGMRQKLADYRIQLDKLRGSL